LKNKELKIAFLHERLDNYMEKSLRGLYFVHPLSTRTLILTL